MRIGTAQRCRGHRIPPQTNIFLILYLQLWQCDPNFASRVAALSTGWHSASVSGMNRVLYATQVTNEVTFDLAYLLQD
jgi:hypothetical protein